MGSAHFLGQITFPMANEPEWLIECLGVDDTVRLIEISGGLPLYVPGNIRNSPVRLLAEFDERYGLALSRKLVAYFGGGVIKVPLAQKWRVEVYHARGMSPEAIARELRCNYVTVLRRLSQLRAGGKSGANTLSRIPRHPR